VKVTSQLAFAQVCIALYLFRVKLAQCNPTIHQPRIAGVVMSQQLQRVQQVIDAWRQLDIEGVLECLTDDIEYHYLVGQRPLVGKEWVRRFLVKFGHGQSDIKWRIANHASNGDLLMIEGIDDYIDAGGNHIRTPYMGVFEFRDGKICRWRDYVDPGLISMAKAREPFPAWLEELVA
jgi:limonene-1,2-epoxide hydrolase